MLAADLSYLKYDDFIRVLDVLNRYVVFKHTGFNIYSKELIYTERAYISIAMRAEP